MFDFTPWSLLGSLLFGTIGMAALAYGKRVGSIGPLAGGAALLVFPYFVSSTWALFAIGAVLTGLTVRYRE
ncbi:MAG: hypothetical protein KDA44_03400 [Planctomycetales bacterium]|nr:hypothetical protein [Planctomycetales bacterium]